MADGIRGKEYLHFPDDVIKGIVLHRNIDTFTDAHATFRKSKHRLHANYGHYSGVIIDIFYDHFLAKNWSLYSDELLSNFVANFYKSLENNLSILTDKTKQLLPYMIQFNWLESYKTIEGIETILTQMDKRIKNNSKMRFSIIELRQFYTEFEAEFTSFFAELNVFAKQKIQQL